MPNKKMVRWLLISVTLIMLIITIYMIVNIYAVFYSEVSGISKSNLAKWNITINGTNISSGITEEFVMNKFNVIQNQNVKEGKIAPGVTGNFEILINAVNTEVSFRYDISIDTSYLKDKKITITSIEEINRNNRLFKTGENTYTGIMLLSDIKNNYTNNIKITFYWENDENNNLQDTSLGTTLGSKLQIPIIVNAIQYLGEEILDV